MQTLFGIINCAIIIIVYKLLIVKWCSLLEQLGTVGITNGEGQQSTSYLYWSAVRMIRVGT